jgi:hypothetical protein
LILRENRRFKPRSVAFAPQKTVDDRPYVEILSGFGDRRARKASEQPFGEIRLAAAAGLGN